MAARRARSGYTLFEVLLVLAIIVLVTAVFLPTLEGMFAYHKMNGCIDSVRGAWVIARAQAIEDSRPYRFAVSGSRYRVAPDSDDYWPTASGDSDNPGYVLEAALPGGVRFASDGQGPATAPDKPVEEKIGSPANWTTKAVFLPDGTARDNAELLFNIPGTRPRSIHLRALTGTMAVKTEGEEGTR